MHTRTAIFGGSFNPPHIAHFRLAHEVLEQLSPKEIVFMPSASAPHKSNKGLLPFTLRCELLRSYIKDKPKFSLSTLESELSYPSYTVNTLHYLHQQKPEEKFLFIMGAENIEILPQWKEWEKLLLLTDIVCLPRSVDFTQKDFILAVNSLPLPAQKIETPPVKGSLHYELANGCNIIYLSHHAIELSSTFLRERWRKNLGLDLFLPDSVLIALRNNIDSIDSIWGNS